MIKIKTRKPGKIISAWFVLLLFIFLAVTPVVSAIMTKIIVEDLTKEADVIVIGHIKKVESRWSLGRTAINTYATLSVEKYIKGAGKETLTIITEGGSKWGFNVKVEDTPEFTKNENVLVFLKKAGSEFSVTGWVQGKYNVENENVRDISGEKIPLEDFLSRIDNAIPPQDAAAPARTPAAPGFGLVLWVMGVLAVWRRLKK